MKFKNVFIVVNQKLKIISRYCHMSFPNFHISLDTTIYQEVVEGMWPTLKRHPMKNNILRKI